MKMERNNDLLYTSQLDQKDTSHALILNYFIIKILELTDHPWTVQLKKHIISDGILYVCLF